MFHNIRALHKQRTRTTHCHMHTLAPVESYSRQKGDCKGSVYLMMATTGQNMQTYGVSMHDCVDFVIINIVLQYDTTRTV